ncbi:MAG: 2-oxoacid:acceptor oxidoreductase family protein [Chloroflexi bacterium]|nr:2-oxoacid:acceptor oxidoreductase family protein [Chloroflexota bacterium]
MGDTKIPNPKSQNPNLPSPLGRGAGGEGRYELRFSGEGGQGIILGGSILAEAAILHQGKYAVQSPQYGSRVRGGPTKVDVIVSDSPILYPRATKIDFFLALAQMSYNQYATDLADDAVLLVDANLVPHVIENGHVIHRLPIVEIAKIELDNEVLSNSVALGAVVALTGIVSHEAAWNAIEARVPAKAREINRRAFERGLEAAELCPTKPVK